MFTIDFAANLRKYAVEAKQRYDLLVEYSENIGGHPAYVPEWWTKPNAYWIDQLERTYWNMAEFEGWPELPGYDAEAAKRIRESRE